MIAIADWLWTLAFPPSCRCVSLARPLCDRKCAAATWARRQLLKGLTPGTLGSYFRPPPEVIERWCAWGSSARESGNTSLVDPSPDPLEPRRQRHPRDRDHGDDASHLCRYGLCPKHFRGAVRPAFSWSRAGRQFHGARQAATGEPSLPAGVDSARLSASGRSLPPQGSARHYSGRYGRTLRLLRAPRR